MKVLILGSGGRESMMAKTIANSPLVRTVIVSPASPVITSLHPKIQNSTQTWQQLHRAAPLDLVVVGPEDLLCQGIADELRLAGIPVVGPSKLAAQIEGSKDFCKDVLVKAGIATARYETFTNKQAALNALETWTTDVVVKCDGLCAGKGVVVTSDKAQAARAITGFFDGTILGTAVDKLVLEEKLSGPEVSCFALCNGEDFVWLGSACDHKRLLNDDQGPNTGGMGTLSPAPWLSSQDEIWIAQNVFAPVLKEMKRRGASFQGFLFAGLMQTPAGFQVLEFNARMGDPETQSLWARFTEDIVPVLMMAALNKKLPKSFKVSEHKAMHVVMAAYGYPGTEGVKVRKGDQIQIQEQVMGTTIIPAGVSLSNDQWLTNGGRVLGVTALGESWQEVRKLAYQQIQHIHFSGQQFRTDIAQGWT